MTNKRDNSRSRTDREQDFELNILIQSRTIENEIKTIINTRGRKKIETNIKKLQDEIILLNSIFNDYKKELLK